ncbi:hypothetical protein E6H19_05965 [Candidatus Bathyarchaeota archaeon]|nr:MAG: hypothetical protein E6H30_07715 [Candidatus Bathyarchaeota archaeon]TMI44978.1 MAG: hypothetical protein E6H19_05965 [Candidatus Bathyarchaeota archaeon]
MPDKPAVFMLDKPHFQVKLHSDLLKVDLKEGARAEIEKLAEAQPALRDTIGWVFQTIIPLDVHLWEIEKVTVEPSGKVNIRIPHRRDIHIPLEPLEAERLVDKMNELIPVEKERRVERQLAEQAAEKDRERQKADTQKYRLTR